MERTTIPLDAVRTIRGARPLGATARVAVHEVARKLAGYSQPIDYAATGEDAQGVKIAVNTVGRWLFGVPGYSGHLRIVPEGTALHLYYPASSHQIVHDFVDSLEAALSAETWQKEA